MKNWIMVVMACVMFCGCGASQKDLRKVNDLLEKSKTVDCETIHTYLNAIQSVIQKKMK